MSWSKDDTKAGFELFYTAQDHKKELGMHPDYYEEVHQQRFDDTVNLLKLNQIHNQKICDLGCGPGGIISRLDKSNKIIGMDGYDFNDEKLPNYQKLPFEFIQADFDYDKFSEKVKEKQDVLLSFETFEHLCNPYNFFLESKKMLVEGGIFYLTYPQIDMQHNTFYPGLIYDKTNFDEFLGQMAFSILHHGTMPTRYGRLNVYVLRNESWKKVKMKFNKDKEANLVGQPPHIQINL